MPCALRRAVVDIGADGLRRQATPQRLAGRILSRIDRIRERRFAMLMFTPAAILVLVVLAPPIVAVFVMSLWRIDLLGDLPSRYVGLANLHLMFSDPFFRSSILRTVFFAAGATAIT